MLTIPLPRSRIDRVQSHYHIPLQYLMQFLKLTCLSRCPPNQMVDRNEHYSEDEEGTRDGLMPL